MKRGFRFDETMSGTYALAGSPDRDRPFSFSVECVAPSLLREWLDGTLVLRGTVEAPGLAACAACEGTMTLLPLRRRIIGYDLAFRGDDRSIYRVVGEKRIRLGNLRKSFTELPASIYDANGEEIATCLTRFDTRADMVQFLSSWRTA